MEKEPTKPFVRSEPPADVAPREDVRASSSPVRCPFCHEDVSSDARDWVACRKCLARHHAGCWRESGACASCRGTESLAAVPRPNRRRQHMAGLVAAGLAALWAVGLQLWMDRSHHPPVDPMAENVAKDGAAAKAPAAARPTKPETAAPPLGPEKPKTLAPSIRLYRVLWAANRSSVDFDFEVEDAKGVLVRKARTPYHDVETIASGEGALSPEDHTVTLTLVPDAAKAIFPSFPDLEPARDQRLVLVLGGHRVAVTGWSLYQRDLHLTLGDASATDLSALEATYLTPDSKR